MLPFRKLNVYSNQTCLSYVGSMLLLLFNIDVICVIKCVANPSPVAIINKTMTCGLFYSFRFMWFWESGECVFALLCFFFVQFFFYSWIYFRFQRSRLTYRIVSHAHEHAHSHKQQNWTQRNVEPYRIDINEIWYVWLCLQMYFCLLIVLLFASWFIEFIN